MRFRKRKVVWIVKTTTKSGADYMIRAFKNREDAVDYEVLWREKYRNNLWIEKCKY